jgi:hypothetical protein
MMGLEALCASIFALLLGLILLFVGYRFFLLLLPVVGFFAGFFIGASAISLLLGDAFLATLLGWVLGFVIGLIFALFSYLFYIVGVALVAGAAGYALGSGLIFAVSDNLQIVAFVAGIVLAIIVAVLVLAFNVQKWLIIIITAFSGASGIFMSVLLLLNKVDITDVGNNPIRPVWDDSPLWFLLWLALAVTGAVIQFLSTRGYILEPPDSGRAW